MSEVKIVTKTEAENLPGTHQLHYKDPSGNQQVIILQDTHYKYFKQAQADYKLSKDFIYDTWIHIWNKAIKSYLLYTGDRQMYIKEWQSNIALGTIRSQVDIYSSFLETLPQQFIVKGLNKAAFEQAPSDLADKVPTGATRYDRTCDFVNYVSEITQFSEQAALGLIEGVQIGTTCFKTMYQNNLKDENIKIVSFVGGEFMEIEYQNEHYDTPYSVCLDMYHVFPDPLCGKSPRFVIERDIVSQFDFLTMFGAMIMSEENEMKFNQEDLSKILSNENGADFHDYANIRNDIYAAKNAEFAKADALYVKNRPVNGMAMKNRTSERSERIEYQFCEYKDRYVLIANNYPMFIAPNNNGKLMYDFVNAYRSRGLLGEGLSYLLTGVADLEDSFGNNYFDNARAAAHGRWVGDKNAFDGTPELDDIPPGGVLWGNRSIRDSIGILPNPPISDMGIMNIAQGYTQKLGGVSEIDSGQASKLRVAAEGAALSGATNRRLNGYTKRYMTSIGAVGLKWIDSFKRQHVKEDESLWAFCRDQDGVDKTFNVSAADLSGSYNCTMDAQGLFAMSGESGVQKKMDMFKTFAPYLQPPQIKAHMQSIYRDVGMSPAIYLPEEAIVTKPPIKGSGEVPPADSPLAELYGDKTPEQVNGEATAAAMNATGPMDQGNGGQGEKGPGA